MASITLRTPHDSGVTVTAYPASNWNSWLRPPTGAPVGSSTTSGSTGADGSVTLTGLADGTEYYAHTNVGGHRYIGFRTDATAPSAGGSVAPRVAALGNLGATPTLALGPTDVFVWATGTLTANAVLDITGLATGQTIRLLFAQDATGGRTLSLKVGASTVAVTVAAAANAVSIVDALSPDGSDLYARGVA